MLRIVAVLVLLVPLSVFAASLAGGVSVPARPFGGQVLELLPCYNLSGYYILLGPPTPGIYIYQFGGTFSYLFGPPAHIGQWLLGMAGPASTCDIAPGDKFIGKTGGRIIFHGSSK